MTTLSEIRHELGELVGADLDVVSPALGGQVNPPCVVVGHDSPFLVPLTYGGETVRHIVYVVSGPGEGSARVDDLEDQVDKVRDALREKSASGLRFMFGEVDPPGADGDYLVCAVHVSHERQC